MTKLTERNQDGRGQDESRDHRMGQVVCDRSHPQDAECQQHPSGKRRKRQGRHRVTRGSLFRHSAQSRRGHERDDGHRPDCQCPTRPAYRIK